MNPSFRIAAATAAAGIVVIFAGVIVVDGWSRAFLLVPLAILVGGLRWAHLAQPVTAAVAQPVDPDGLARSRVPASPHEPAGSHEPIDSSMDTVGVVPPVVVREDVAAVASSPQLPVDRDAAAREFDLSSGRLDELVNPPQCPRCGRYREVRVSRDRKTINCLACGGLIPFGDGRPTLVRTFDLSDEPIDHYVRHPGSARPPTAPQPPLDHGTVLIDSPTLPRQPGHPH